VLISLHALQEDKETKRKQLEREEKAILAMLDEAVKKGQKLT
jgi:hypothetical protein